MALVQCPECGKSVSSTITACIHCGFDIRHLTAAAPNGIRTWEQDNENPSLGGSTPTSNVDSSSKLIKEAAEKFGTSAGAFGKRVNRSSYPIVKFLVFKPFLIVASAGLIVLGIFLAIWAMPLFGNQCSALVDASPRTQEFAGVKITNDSFQKLANEQGWLKYFAYVCMPTAFAPAMKMLPSSFLAPLGPVAFGWLLVVVSALALVGAVILILGVWNEFRTGQKPNYRQASSLFKLKSLRFVKKGENKESSGRTLKVTLLTSIAVLGTVLFLMFTIQITNAAKTEKNSISLNLPTPLNNSSKSATSDPTEVIGSKTAPASIVGPWRGLGGGLFLLITEVQPQNYEANFVTRIDDPATNQPVISVLATADLQQDENNNLVFRWWGGASTFANLSNGKLEVGCQNLSSETELAENGCIFEAGNETVSGSTSRAWFIDNGDQNGLKAHPELLQDPFSNIAFTGNLSIQLSPGKSNPASLTSPYQGLVTDSKNDLSVNFELADYGFGLAKVYWQDALQRNNSHTGWVYYDSSPGGNGGPWLDVFMSCETNPDLITVSKECLFTSQEGP